VEQINPQEPYLLISADKPDLSRLLVFERNPVFIIKSKIIILSDGKTGFRKSPTTNRLIKIIKFGKM
jgi:hypothetical protein